MADKYDVFISCKSEDYLLAGEIYDFLRQNGVNAFLASKELRRLKESEYRRAISQAMKDAYHLIVFASKAEYVDSTWVYYEWDMFVNAKLKGFKPGNIVTILKDVRTDEINMDLWKYESLTFDAYKVSLLQYVETEASRKRAAELEDERRKLEEQRRRREEEQRRIVELRSRLARFAEDYRKALAALAVDAAKIVATMKALNIDGRLCPVCGTKNEIEATYCPVCAWHFSPIDGVSSLEYLASVDSGQLEAHRHIYKANLLADTTDIKAENEKLKSEVLGLGADLDNARKEIAGLNELIEGLREPKSRPGITANDTAEDKQHQEPVHKSDNDDKGVTDSPDEFELYNRGVMLMRGVGVDQDYSKAAECFIGAAMKDYTPAQSYAGMFYYHGWGVEADFTEAFRWFSLAADKDNAIAQFYIGLMYHYGNGVRQSYAEAIRWYELSAAQGFSTAESNLGMMYEQGLGIDSDYSKAVLWYGRAAEHGDDFAQSRLGYIYQFGKAGTQNYSLARKWYRLAAEQGNQDAIAALKQLGE